MAYVVVMLKADECGQADRQGRLDALVKSTGYSTLTIEPVFPNHSDAVLAAIYTIEIKGPAAPVVKALKKCKDVEDVYEAPVRRTM